MSVVTLAMMLQVFFPLFDSVVHERVKLSLVNSSPQAEEFTLKVHTSEGAQLHEQRLILAPGAQALLSGRALGGPSPAAASWVRVESSNPRFAAAIVFSPEDVLAAVDGATTLASTIHIPGVRVRTGFVELNAADTLLVVINPTDRQAGAGIRFIDNAGAVRGAGILNIPPGGRRRLWASEVLSDGTRPNITFEGRILIQSDTPVAAWQRVERPLSWSALRGKAPEELNATLLIAPFFVFGGGYETTVHLSNPGPTPASLEVWGLSPKGAPLGTRFELTLQPGQTLVSRVEELLRIPVIAIDPPPVITGSVRIRQNDSAPAPLLAAVTIVRTGSQLQRLAELTYWLSGPEAGTWTIPFVNTAEHYYSGYAIANPNDGMPFHAAVSIQVFDSRGILRQQRTSTLSPGEMLTALVVPGIMSGYLIVRSGWPISVLNAIGSHDGQLLESVPAGR